jgi:hypothetical protein
MAATSSHVPKLFFPLFLKAYRELLLVDFQLHRRGFAAVHAGVKSLTASGQHADADACAEICHAVDVACVFYFKEVQCLQRSAATVRLLRRQGVPAELVTGVQQWPFRAHAWVEIAGRVVNDKPHITESFLVIDRC